MKPKDRTWREHLEHGIRLMEGTETEPPWSGQRDLRQAVWVFDECVMESHDPAVTIEAYFRLAQVAHYRGDSSESHKRLGQGTEKLAAVSVDNTTHAQCCLLKGIILVDLHQLFQAFEAYSEAMLLCPDVNFKLKGDINNRLGRLWADHGQEFTSSRLGGSYEACIHFERAVAAYQAIADKDNTVLHALAAASSRAGIAQQRCHGYRAPEAFQHFTRAEELLAGRVREPCIRAAYWYNRSRFALRSFRLPQTVWFFLRCLLPGLKCWRQKRR